MTDVYVTVLDGCHWRLYVTVDLTPGTACLVDDGEIPERFGYMAPHGTVVYGVTVGAWKAPPGRVLIAGANKAAVRRKLQACMGALYSDRTLCPPPGR